MIFLCPTCLIPGREGLCCGSERVPQVATTQVEHPLRFVVANPPPLDAEPMYRRFLEAARTSPDGVVRLTIDGREVGRVPVPGLGPAMWPEIELAAPDPYQWDFEPRGPIAYEPPPYMYGLGADWPTLPRAPRKVRRLLLRAARIVLPRKRKRGWRYASPALAAYRADFVWPRPWAYPGALDRLLLSAGWWRGRERDR